MNLSRQLIVLVLTTKDAQKHKITNPRTNKLVLVKKKHKNTLKKKLSLKQAPVHL